MFKAHQRSGSHGTLKLTPRNMCRGPDNSRQATAARCALPHPEYCPRVPRLVHPFAVSRAYDISITHGTSGAIIIARPGLRAVPSTGGRAGKEGGFCSAALSRKVLCAIWRWR